MENNRRKVDPTGFEIAVIGMSCRFPGAESVEELYNNLKNGVESIEFLSKEELLKAGISQSVIDNPNYINARSTFKSVEEFDAEFFGYTPNEARIMDPQMRVMHECVWEAIESAGYGPRKYNKPIGLFVGGTSNQYWEYITMLKQVKEKDIYDPEKIVDLFSNSLLNDMDLMATRISYKLDLHGPSMNLFSSCSTSLAAVHYACQALNNGDCDMAVAGGASIMTPERVGYLYKEGLILSHDGHNRIFDKDSTGTIFGDGVGTVVLKRLDDAIEDKDTIHAVIRGSAINNDGGRKIGYSAPSVEGQADVIKKALAFAELESDDIQFVETHGTGTKIGDPIEFKALTEVFQSQKRNQCALGSIKTNFGHLNSAAGIAGLIKAILVVKYGELFPTLNFTKPSEDLDFSHSPFYVNTELVPLRSSEEEVIYGGVSSFGVGGTNVHVILESPPLLEKEKTNEENYQIIGISAKTKEALEEQNEKLLQYMKQENDERLEDISYTLMKGKEEFTYRKAFLCKNKEECIECLSGNKPRLTLESEAVLGRNKVVFMFPGQGSSYARMGCKLYETQQVFREEMDRCFHYFNIYANVDLKQYMEWNTDTTTGEENEKTLYLLFSYECALAKLMMSFGISPDYVMGYSFGELTAAYIADVFELKDIIEFIVLRNRLMEGLPKGAMLSVPLSCEETKELLIGKVDIAIDNGDSCIVSGPEEEIRLVEQNMKTKRVLCYPLNVPFASHSHMMEAIVPELEQFLSKKVLNRPEIPIISGLTGERLSTEMACSASYWSEYIAKQVQFLKSVEKEYNKNFVLFLEMGPGMSLTNLLKRFYRKDFNSCAVELVKEDSENISEQVYLYHRLIYLWTHGLKIDWSNFYTQDDLYHIPLPTYPFKKTKYPIYQEDRILPSTSNNVVKEVYDGKLGANQWYYQTSWRLAPIPDVKPLSQARVLIFSDTKENANRLLQSMREENHVTAVTFGTSFIQVNQEEYQINGNHALDYSRLYEELENQGEVPDKIIFFLGKDQESSSLENRVEDNFFLLLTMLQSFPLKQKTSIYIVSDGMYQVYGNETVYPEKQLILPLIKIMSQENLNTDCFYIDVDKETAMDILTKQFNYIHPTREIALRNGKRWVKDYERVSLKAEDTKIKEQGIYLITGGLGNIGLSLADYLTKQYEAKVILVSRSPLPEEETWDSILENPKEKSYRRVSMIRKFKEENRDFKVYAANVADTKEMKVIVNEIEASWGKIDGVIHAAGMTGAHLSKPISMMRKQEYIEQFEPKIQGTLALYQIFKDYELDFMLMISSLATILGGLGYIGYAAANSFLDGFYESLSEKDRKFLLCVNWESWDFGEEQDQNSKLGESNSLLAITEEESYQVLEHLLMHLGNHFVVSSGDINARVQKWVGLSTVKEEEEQQVILEEMPHSSDGVGKERPHLLTPYQEAKTEVEQKLVRLWEDYLGILEIGTLDSFFELGADSLKAVVMISKISAMFQQELPLVQFFNHPTIADTASYLKVNQEDSYGVIPKAKQSDSYVISYAQRRILLTQLMDKESCLYNETQAFLLQGNVELAKIEKVFAQIVNRHEILRTIYQVTEEGERQVILNDATFKVEELMMDESTSLEDTVVKFRRPFQLDSEIPIRIGFGKVEKERSLLIIDVHHIATDGVSDNYILQDFVDFYNGKMVPELKIQYKDYASWLATSQQQKVKEAQQRFWLEAYKNGYELLDLPTDYKRPAIRKEEGGQITLSLDKEFTRQLQEVTEQTNSTLFMLLFSIFNVLMSRYSGQDRILIGVPIAGRRSQELEELIGVFVNMLAVQTEIDEECSLREFIQDVKDEMLKAYDNQEYPFEELVHDLNVNRDPCRNPLIDVVFVMQSEDDFQVQLDQIQIEKVAFQNHMSKYDLQCSAFLKEDELQIQLDYNTSIFKESSIQRLGDCFYELLLQTASNIEQKVSDLRLMSKEIEEKNYIVSKPVSEMKPNDTIVSLLNEAAIRYSENVAVCYQDQDITYQELMTRANKLANRLRRDGVGPNTVVTLYFQPCIEMIVAIIATLKSGGTYLPIDPKYPINRCEYEVKDSNSTYLLTHHLVPLLPFFEQDHVYYVENTEEYETELDEISVPIQGEDMAYIIYTSGTTGMPKGVMVKHENVYHLFADTVCEYEFNSSDIWTLFHSFCFDFSVWEIWGALLFGGKLCVVTEEEKKDPHLYLELLSREKVTVLNQTPSAFYNLIEEASMGEKLPLSIRYIIFGGEALAPIKLKRWLNLYPDVLFVNMYGITETTVHVTIKKLSNEEIWENSSSVGVPIPGMSAYILDSKKRPLPVGVYGELYVGGAGVSKGYMNQPELTKKAFCTNYYEPDQIAFKTGDRARLTESGEIEYSGRVDRQIQLRGFRIELGEIEYRLLEMEGISEAIVVSNNDSNEDLHIIAYYVSNCDYEVETLKANLSKSLPEYMIPSFIIRLESIPLTVNKKVDYRQLPNPVEVISQEQVVSPEDELERKMLGIWSQILQLEKEKISVLKNFFDLGGNSLKIMQLNRLIRDEFGVSIPVVYLFKYTTIRSLVHFIRSGEENTEQEVYDSKNALNDGKKRMQKLRRYRE